MWLQGRHGARPAGRGPSAAASVAAERPRVLPARPAPGVRHPVARGSEPGTRPPPGSAALVSLSEAWSWASLRGHRSRGQKQSHRGPAARGASSRAVPRAGVARVSRAPWRPLCGTRGCHSEEGQAGPGHPRGAVVPCCGPQAQAASREREGRSPARCWPAGLSATLRRAVAPARGPGQWRPQGSWEWEDKQETQALGLPRPPRPPPACGGPPRALSSQRPPGRVLAGHWARPGR